MKKAIEYVVNQYPQFSDKQAAELVEGIADCLSIPPAKCTEPMLAAAVDKAVDVRLLPRCGIADNVAVNWNRVEQVVNAALAAGGD